MQDRTNPIREQYEAAKEDETVEWGRVVYEIPHGPEWDDAEGYVTGDMGGVVTVITDDSLRKINGSQVIYTHYKVEDAKHD